MKWIDVISIAVAALLAGNGALVGAAAIAGFQLPPVVIMVSIVVGVMLAVVQRELPSPTPLEESPPLPKPTVMREN